MGWLMKGDDGENAELSYLVTVWEVSCLHQSYTLLSSSRRFWRRRSAVTIQSLNTL